MRRMVALMFEMRSRGASASGFESLRVFNGAPPMR